jgi:hypothetical protein
MIDFLSKRFEEGYGLNSFQVSKTTLILAISVTKMEAVQLPSYIKNFIFPEQV